MTTFLIIIVIAWLVLVRRSGENFRLRITLANIYTISEKIDEWRGKAHMLPAEQSRTAIGTTYEGEIIYDTDIREKVRRAFNGGDLDE